MEDKTIYEEFFSSVSCLFVEGVEFMNKAELYDAIKSEWERVVVQSRQKTAMQEATIPSSDSGSKETWYCCGGIELGVDDVCICGDKYDD